MKIKYLEYLRIAVWIAAIIVKGHAIVGCVSLIMLAIDWIEVGKSPSRNDLYPGSLLFYAILDSVFCLLIWGFILIRFA